MLTLELLYLLFAPRIEAHEKPRLEAWFETFDQALPKVWLWITPMILQVGELLEHNVNDLFCNRWLHSVIHVAR